MSEKLKVVMDQRLKKRLEKVAEKTGLNLSEIARRGVYEECQKLEGIKDEDR